ncbi:MAG: 2Fe-2S iron-sulfur cluster-binding protein [Alphaproteobacteria bacterium]|nr:2Fe-2S iron-sulfur cluster-binding protein [Alphaproteobacteria bacterium]
MKIIVNDRAGLRRELDAIEGWRVMEIIRDYGMTDPSLGIKAECGGALACGTCHVYVAKEWQDKIPPASEDEIYMLDEAFEVTEDSRLCCQIIMNEALDGIEVTLAPGSEP